MKRENFFTNVNTVKKTKSSKLEEYTKIWDDMVNEEKTLSLM